jgi:hypothetical protein
MQFRMPWVWAMVAVLLACGLCGRAAAALGGSVDSVRADQVRMKATVKVVKRDLYTVYEIRDATGTVVREYVSNDGIVFGVVWQGPFVPDMRQILGTYFERYAQASKAQRESRVGRYPLDIRESGLVIQTSGHQRAYSGRVFDERLLPAAVSVSDVW